MDTGEFQTSCLDNQVKEISQGINSKGKENRKEKIGYLELDAGVQRE